MTRLSGEFRTDLPVHEAIVACAEAIDGLGWQIDAVDGNRIVSRAATGSHRPEVEVVLSESGQGTNVLIVGTDTDAEPLTQVALTAELERVRDAINASLEAATEAPPQGPPPKTGRTKEGRTRKAIIGIIAGLLAIALGIIAIAIVNNPSKDHESTGASKPKPSKPKPSKPKPSKPKSGSPTTPQQTGQEPAPSGSPGLGLGETAKIRDGDQHFALTPTAVGREGSYITVEIEVAGLGKHGYDGTGQAFLASLLGSNGQRYGVASSGGPSGCEPPTATLTNGQTRNGCLPFKVPPGVQADTFQYEPFFIGGDRVQWGLK
jgi:hypothetical protein